MLNRFVVVGFLLVISCSGLAQAGLVTGDILNSYAFTDGNFAPGTYSFNIWDDTSGAILASDNGDLADLTITYTNSVGALGSASMAYASGSGTFRQEHAFTGPPPVDNPGSRIEQVVTFEFADHLQITELQVDYRSLNTRGIVWETSRLGYLQEDGTEFSSTPTIDPYLTHTEIEGSPSQGWFVTDSKGTVNNVGTATVSAGSSGQNDNLTQADAGVNNLLDFADVGLTSGVDVTGGFRWITTMEDVRGTLNGDSNFSTTLTLFNPIGTIGLPEPSSFGLVALASVACCVHRRRRSESMQAVDQAG